MSQLSARSKKLVLGSSGWGHNNRALGVSGYLRYELIPALYCSSSHECGGSSFSSLPSPPRLSAWPVSGPLVRLGPLLWGFFRARLSLARSSRCYCQAPLWVRPNPCSGPRTAVSVPVLPFGSWVRLGPNYKAAVFSFDFDFTETALEPVWVLAALQGSLGATLLQVAEHI